jgi:hypothetical protein
MIPYPTHCIFLFCQKPSPHVVMLLATPSGQGHPVLFRDTSKKGMIPSNSALCPPPPPTAITMKFLTMTTMLMGDIIPSRAYLALTVIAISGIGMPSLTRRIISTSSSLREISRLLSPLYDSFGGRDNAHNSMPSNDEIATQKCEAYAALSLFHKRLSSLPDASSLLLMSSSRMWLIFRGLKDKYHESSSLLSLRRAEYWSCIDGVTLYMVLMDPAANIGIGRPSRPYRCMVSVMADIDVNGGGGGGRGSSGRRRGRGGLRLVETVQPISAAGGEDVIEDVMPFSCLLSLGANVDIDPVNGSYSLDNVVVVNRPSPNNNNDDDDDNDDNGDGNGGRFSTLPLLPASTFIIIGSGGTPSLTRRIISTSSLSREFARSSSTTASADGNLMTNCCRAVDIAHCHR